MEREDSLPVPSKATNMIEVIAKAATNKNMDIAKLEKLMDLQERVLNHEAEMAYNRDFVQMKPHLPTVIKGKYNEQTKSYYADLKDINEQIDPVLSQYGFGTETKVIEQTETHVKVVAILRHSGGFKSENPVLMPLDKLGMKGSVNKTDVHAIASSITYAKRIALCGLLNISTDDVKDTDGNMPNDTLTEAQIEHLRAKMMEVGMPVKLILEKYNTESLDDILANEYWKCKFLIENYVNKASVSEASKLFKEGE